MSDYPQRMWNRSYRYIKLWIFQGKVKKLQVSIEQLQKYQYIYSHKIAYLFPSFPQQALNERIQISTKEKDILFNLNITVFL